MYDFRVMRDEPCYEYIDGLRKIFHAKYPDRVLDDYLYEDVSIRVDGLPVSELSQGKKRNYLASSQVFML